MPKVKTKFGQENKLIHPKSRKAQQISRSWHRDNRVKHVKKETGIKMSIVGEKIAWFRDQLQEDSADTCTPQKTLELIEKYLHRFDEELCQIELKYQVGGQRTSRQHASREDTIKHTMQQEKEDFETCGLEIPDLLCHKNLEYLLSWTGELRFLQNITLKRYRKRDLGGQAPPKELTEKEEPVDTTHMDM